MAWPSLVIPLFILLRFLFSFCSVVVGPSLFIIDSHISQSYIRKSQKWNWLVFNTISHIWALNWKVVIVYPVFTHFKMPKKQITEVKICHRKGKDRFSYQQICRPNGGESLQLSTTLPLWANLTYLLFDKGTLCRHKEANRNLPWEWNHAQGTPTPSMGKPKVICTSEETLQLIVLPDCCRECLFLCCVQGELASAYNTPRQTVVKGRMSEKHRRGLYVVGLSIRSCPYWTAYWSVFTPLSLTCSTNRLRNFFAWLFKLKHISRCPGVTIPGTICTWVTSDAKHKVIYPILHN